MAKKAKNKRNVPHSRKFHRKRKNNKPVKEEVILGLGPKIINSTIQSLDDDDINHVRNLVEGLDEYDLAKLIESLDFTRRTKLIGILGDKLDPEVFPELNEVIQEQIIDSLDENQIANIVNELDSDEAVELLEHMDDEEQKNVIAKLSPELKTQVKSSLSYPEDSAGRIMVREFVSMPDDWTVAEAKKHLLTDQDLPDEFYTIFLTDNNYRPTGEISLDKLLRAKSSEKLRNIMDGEIVPIDVNTDQEEVAHMFREYGWISATVVDAKRRLIGVINIDDIVHIIHEEASEDVLHLSGAEEGDVYRSVFSIFKSRSMWLVVNLFATIIASTVVEGFQDIIAQVAVLAVLMPIVASMGGTTGNQTLAVVVRAIATKELTSRNTWAMIGKEFAVGILNGMLFAGMIGLITYFRFPEFYIASVIIGIAMLFNLIIASLAGILIPLILNKFKADPAISSGVFLIAITDSFGFFIFLALAKIFLF
jgi:magnesium transporter